MDSKEPLHLSVCHTGVVLRVMLGMLVIVWLTSWFGANSFEVWLQRWVHACVGAVPACLLWLVAICGLQRHLAHRPLAIQQTVAAAIGALAGAYGYFQSVMVDWWLGHGVGNWWGWAPPMATGALLALVCLSWLQQRQQQQVPVQTQARLDELQARIRPHFLFNTLNTAMALVQADPDRAEEVLQDLAELFRRALDEPDSQARLAEEIDLARRYLGIEQLRFGDRLKVSWQLDAQADDIATPVLLLQPLVENAIRHGVEPSVAGGWVEVNVSQHRGRVSVEVLNSLPDHGAADGASGANLSTAGHGMALRNVQQRLQLLHDVEAEFDAGRQAPTASHPQPHFRVRCAWPV
jgi:two-component system, LytTR family, sensor histidine kinase AlgZ